LQRSRRSSLYRYCRQDGLLKIVLLKGEEITFLEAGDEFLKLNLRAIDNSILSSGLTLATSEPSFLVNDAIELIELVGEVEGMISTDVKDISTQTLSLYPNPTTDVFNINTTDMDLANEYNIVVYDISGNEVYRASQVRRVDVSGFEAGLYLVIIEAGTEKHIGKINVLRP